MFETTNQKEKKETMDGLALDHARSRYKICKHNGHFESKKVQTFWVSFHPKDFVFSSPFLIFSPHLLHFQEGAQK